MKGRSLKEFIDYINSNDLVEKNRKQGVLDFLLESYGIKRHEYSYHFIPTGNSRGQALHQVELSVVNRDPTNIFFNKGVNDLDKSMNSNLLSNPASLQSSPASSVLEPVIIDEIPDLDLYRATQMQLPPSNVNSPAPNFSESLNSSPHTPPNQQFPLNDNDKTPKANLPSEGKKVTFKVGKQTPAQKTIEKIWKRT